MDNRYKYIALVLALSVIGVVGYRVITPKAVLVNISDQKFDEFIISLPASGVSFGPIEGQSTNTIYYSPQKAAGIGTYSLVLKNSELSNGEFSYDEGREWGRKIRFTIRENGVVSIE